VGVRPGGRSRVTFPVTVIALLLIVMLSLLTQFVASSRSFASGSQSPSLLAMSVASLLDVPCRPILFNSGIERNERSKVSSLHTCDNKDILVYSLNESAHARKVLFDSADQFGIYEYVVGEHWIVQILDGALPLSSIRRISPGALSKDIGGHIYPTLQPTSPETSPEHGCNGWHFCSGSYQPPEPPLVGQTWHAALAFDICGTLEPAIPASPTGTTSGLTTTGDGLIVVSPRKTSEAGIDATLGKFATEYADVGLTNTAVKYPGGTAIENGQRCPAGTPEAGERGVVRVRSWKLSIPTGGGVATQVGGKYAPKPADLRLMNQELITVGFGPPDIPLPRITGATELALLQAIEGTTAPVTTTAGSS
jgi:hypothetical protein